MRLPLDRAVWFFSLRRALFHGFQAFVSVCRAPHQKQGFASETVWVGMPPVCLSVSRSVCLLLLSSRQPPAPVYMSQAFVYCSVVDGSSFHVAPVVCSSRSKYWERDLALRCLFELWVEVCGTKTYATCAPSGMKTCHPLVCLYVSVSDSNRKFSLRSVNKA